MRSNRSYIFLLIFIGVHWGGFAQLAKLSIQVKDHSSGELLPGAAVKAADVWRVTQEDGLAHFFLFPQALKIRVDFVGFMDTSFNAKLATDTLITVALIPRSLLLQEAEVSVLQSEAVNYMEQEVLHTSISAKDVSELPMIAGEPDILKPLHHVPGVQAGLPGSADIYVRGGDQYQNALLLDGFPVNNLSHALGYASAVPVSSARQLDFYKQAYPLHYGDFSAAVMDVGIKNASTQRVGGEIGGGIGSVRGSFETPIVKGKSGLHLAGRFSTLGMALEVIKQFDAEVESIFGYHDGLAKYHHRLGKRDQLEALAYFSNDAVRAGGVGANSRQSSGANDLLAGLSWLHSSKSGGLAKLKLHFSKYRFDQEREYTSQVEYSEEPYSEGDQFRYSYNYREVGLNFNWKQPLGPRMTISAGFQSTAGFYQLPEFTFSGESGKQTLATGEQLENSNSSLYVSGKYDITKKLRATLGVRHTGVTLTEGNLQLYLLPRASITYSINSHYAVFLAYDESLLTTHRFRNTFYGSAFDLPLPATGLLQPQQSRQLATGVAFKEYHFSSNVQLFYRTLTNAIDRDYSNSAFVYSPEADQLAPAEPLAALLPVDGRAYGVETEVKFTKGIWEARASYTWSRSYRQGELLNGGEEYPFEFNREHQITAFGKVRFKKNSIDKITEIGVSYTYGTGNFTQFPVQYRAPATDDLDVSFISQRNNAQLPPLQHLDLTLNFIAKKEKGTRIFTTSAFNLLSSPLVTNYTIEGDELKGQGPFIFVPSISYTFKFDSL